MSYFEALSFLETANNLNAENQWNVLKLLSGTTYSFTLEDFLRMDEILWAWDSAGKRHA